mgnify:FL=1
MVQFWLAKQHTGCVMRGIVFFAMLMCMTSVQAEVAPDKMGWYSIEKSPHDVVRLFTERVESCLAPSKTSVIVRVYGATDDVDSPASVSGPVQVLLYGRDDADTNGLNAPFGYQNTGVLFVPTIAMSEVWFCAELQHAYAHMVRSIGVKGEEDPVTELQLFALEEISVREDMRDYLNRESSGQYALVLSNAWIKKDETDVQEQVQMLDAVFPSSLSEDEYNIRIEQFRFDLALVKRERVAEKVEAYISLIQSSNP